jgi:hypothetical protein
VDEAASSLLSSITAQPEFTSIVLEIATDSQAFAALTQLLGQPLPTGIQGEDELNSIIGLLPSDAQVFFRSLTAAEGSIVSSIVKAGATVTGATPTTAVTSGSQQLGSSTPGLQTVSNSPSASLGTSPSSSAKGTQAVATQNVGVILRSGGLGLVLAVIGACIAAL